MAFMSEKISFQPPEVSIEVPLSQRANNRLFHTMGPQNAILPRKDASIYGGGSGREAWQKNDGAERGAEWGEGLQK